MTRIVPTQEWWTATEIAASGLPGLPNSKRGVNDLAVRRRWIEHPSLARRRAGRGGGWEYSWKLFPSPAQMKLLKDRPAVADEQMGRGEAWAWFDGLPEKVKATARERLRIIQIVEQMENALGRHHAVVTVARQEKSGARTIWNWIGMIEGVDPADRLPYLAPRHRAAPATRKRAECSVEFQNWLKAGYLRIGGASFPACYDDAVKLCQQHGLAYFECQRTARRWLDRTVPYVTQVFAREGERGLAKCFPPQIRDRSGLTAMEAVNADCHKIDVFVQWPGIEKPVRPQIVAFQDLYSNKILSWRVDLDPNKVAVMGALGELIETWGIPRHCLFDNGREFANKWLTGGAPTRFRFRVRDEDPLGVLPMLGIKVHWATPAHGQAKPIERGFRDFADRIARDPRFHGAYVGNRPDAKPEDYGSRAIPLEDFLRVLDEGIRDHNARAGRLTDTAKGRSFDQTFADSYAVAPIRKATAEQHRLWLMGQEVRKLHADHGQLTLHGNKYWSDWMNSFSGQTVVARFDPENLHAGLYVYSADGEYLGLADCREKVGFFDLTAAKMHAKQQRARRKAEKQLLDALRPVSVGELASELDRRPQAESPLVEAKVVEIAPVRRAKPLIQRTLPTPDADRPDPRDALVVEFRQREAEADQQVAAAESPADRFRRALDVEARADAGQPIGSAEADWLRQYQTTPEYTRQRMLFDDFGDSALG